ncbi:phage tail protein I [Paraburkholderia fungorum]|uniref:phage tail protein I n=1 Tax=Paraburkholderia fungorum TaxID=134537 RepID=UPI00402B1923
MADFIEPSLLPPPLRRDLNCRTLETIAARLSALDLTPLVLYDVDKVPASLLPHLAEQFNVLGDAGWDVADTDDERRALIREAIALHKLKGTRYAVQRALDLMGVVAVIVEWWQRNPQGVPHTFSIMVQLKDQPIGAPPIDASRVDQVRRVVTFWKPARSHFTMTMGFDGAATFGLRVASVFSGQQLLMTLGRLQPFLIEGNIAVSAAIIAAGTQLVNANSTIR